MALQDQRLSANRGRSVRADHGTRLGEVMLDRTEAAQIFQLVEVDMPIVDLVAALPQEIAHHVLAWAFRAASRRNRDKVPCGRKLRVEICVDSVDNSLMAIGRVHFRCGSGAAFRIGCAPIHCAMRFGAPWRHGWRSTAISSEHDSLTDQTSFVAAG